MQTVPSTAEDFVARGNDAMRRKDWPEAVRIWALMREQCPQKPHGYFRGAAALKEQGDFDAADALVLEGMNKFPEAAGLYIEYGDVAVRQKNWPEAAQRWALMRKKFPQKPHGYFRGAAALKEQGDFDAANALALEGLEKFPEEPQLYIQYGEIAVRQEDWQEAVKRWTLMREKFPKLPHGFLGEEASLKKIWDVDAGEDVAFDALRFFPTTDIPKVSVVVPVYNPGSGFERCLASLRTQSLADIEMIIVDDLGTDDAMDKVRVAAVEDSRIRIITNPENLGAGLSRNKGIEAARGEYLAFVDADDYVSPDFLELLYNKAHTERLEIAKGTAVLEVDGLSRQSRRNDGILSGLACHRPLYGLFTGEHWTGLYSRALLMKSGARYGKSYTGQDVVFLLRVCHVAQSFGIENRAIYHYMHRNSSAVHTFNAQRLNNQLDTLREQIDYLVGQVAHNSDATLYALSGIKYCLALYAYAVSIPELGTAAVEYLSGIREQTIRLPYLESLKSRSFIVRALVDFGLGLSIVPWSDHWKIIDNTRACIDLAQRWCDFALAHPELVDEYGADLQQALKRAADAVALKTQYGPQMDVKIYGTKVSELKLLDVSDKDARVTTPVWLYHLCGPGTGYVIEPKRGQTEISLDFVCKTAGKFTVTLRGPDVKDGNGKQIPKWIAYSGLTCNGEVVFENEKQVWYGQPYRYQRPVQAGESMKMRISWKNEQTKE